jgi:hypothetical protein
VSIFPKGFFMAETRESKCIEGCLESLPESKIIRQQIAENIKQRQLLRQLLRLAEQRQKTLGAIQ